MSNNERKHDYRNLNAQTGSYARFASGRIVDYSPDSEEFSRIAGFTARPFVTAAAPEPETEILEEVIRVSEVNNPFTEMRKDLKSFAKLSVGWDGYDAEAPNDIAIYWCQQIIEKLVAFKFFPKGLTPSVEGGVGVYFEEGNRYADIECLNSGTILAVTIEGNIEPQVWEVERIPSSIEEAVKKIRDFLTNQHPRSIPLRGASSRAGIRF